MPELPEVEVLVRHLRPALTGRTIRSAVVRRAKSVRPGDPKEFVRVLTDARIEAVSRRAKYLVFELESRQARKPFRLLGHLGMTGRMYLQPAGRPWATHAAVVFGLGNADFVFEDPRYFGRLSLDLTALDALGPEPLDSAFTTERFERELRRSRQAIKVKLLDQALVAGIGNIYASEALFRAGISPRRPAAKVCGDDAARLRRAIRAVLREAIRFGSTVPLDWAGAGSGDGLFYYGRAEGVPDYYDERLRVYDRAGQPCRRCRTPIQRIVQAARSTFFCPTCQTK
ncbi:MAG: bifunctional DNA-formamidopyrimidine glycosylase/DNA-(apurinic or apyrimidinic site) lyase [Verrucomicrobia bacterium]|nr:bifunctional DNA-formamidopyrimidine glycosylase/DNA-(apurinic or apyrimidinic site) lyase [Verrucomicrobiota bacterium]